MSALRPPTHAPPSARLDALRARLAERGLDAALLTRAAHKRYVAGFTLGEADAATPTAGALLVTADARRILVDSRYTAQAADETPDWTPVLVTGGLHDALPAQLAELGVRSLGLEASATTHAVWTAIADACPEVALEAIDADVAELRVRKAPEEIDAIARACALGDACLADVRELVRAGMTEREVANAIEAGFRERGADGLAFDTIALAGPRAAMPHGRPSDATLAPGNVLLLDFGCRVGGYRSDMTRTLAVGPPDAEVRRVHDAVLRAQAAAIEALRPGVDGRDVDAVARRVIEDAGYEPYGHGLGHGIGLEVHEAPSLRRTSSATLEAGMVFSVEPGIYLPGTTGVRIEDIVVLEEDGPRLLTASPRELVEIG